MPRSVRVLGPAVLLAVALLATFAGLAYGGGAAPFPIQDPGPIARFGLPVAKLLVNLGAAGMIGALVLAVWALAPEAARVRRRPRRRRGIRRRAHGRERRDRHLHVPRRHGRAPRLRPGVRPEARAVRHLDRARAGVAHHHARGRRRDRAVLRRAQPHGARVRHGARRGLAWCRWRSRGTPRAPQGTTPRSPRSGCTSCSPRCGSAGCSRSCCCADQLDGERLPIVLARYSSIALICFIVVARLGLRERRAPHRHVGRARHPVRRARDREGGGPHRARPVRRRASSVPDLADAATDLRARRPRRGIRRP